MIKNLDSPTRTITNSTFKRWLSCPRQFYYRYIGGFRRKLSSPSARMGSLIHAMLESETKQNARIQKAGLREREVARRRANPEAYVSQRLAVMSPLFKAYKEEGSIVFEVDGIAVGEDTSTQAEEDITLCKGIFRNWLLFDDAKDLERYDVISTEFKFEVPLVYRGKQAVGWLLSGLVDCLLWDRQNEIFVLREYKTTSGDPVEYQQRVSLDPQVRIYADALQKSGLTGGRPIQLVEYAVIKRKLPSLPKQIKCKSCKGKKETKSGPCDKCDDNGLVFSTAALDTTSRELALYLSNFPDSPEKRELLEKNEKKTWDKFICVHEHFIQEPDTEETIGEVFRSSEAITRTLKEYQKEKDISCFPKNVNHCTGSYFGCEYRDLCGSRIPVEEVEIRNSNWVEVSDHPELEER